MKHPLTHRFVSTDQAVPTKQQHTKPCADCPFARTALKGWLGGTGPRSEQVEYWIAKAHSDIKERCHCTTNQECAGMAIFRSNVCKMAVGALYLPSDTQLVFASDDEFRKHHGRGKIKF